MKYTFLLPAYKAKFFKLALNSILSQTYTDYKIIISDDNSPENIKGIIDEYTHCDKITYIRSTVNIGGKDLVNHWNKLLKLCDTEYLIMASDDDIYHPDFLSTIDRLSRKYPNANVLRSRVIRINGNGEWTAKEDIFDEYQNSIEAIHSIFCGNYIGCIGNYVFKTSALKKSDGFIYMPFAWFSDILTVVNNLSFGQANTQEPLFYFRVSGCNISSIKKAKDVDKEKLIATIRTDCWLSKYIVTVTSEKTFEQKLISDTIIALKHRIYGQCGDYSWSVPIIKWGDIYQRLKKNSFFSSKSFMKYFSIALINRTL